MKDYRILFGFMRGGRDDVIQLDDDTARNLMDAGLVEPAKPVKHAPEERKVDVPEVKEGGKNAATPTAGRRKP